MRLWQWILVFDVSGLPIGFLLLCAQVSCLTCGIPRDIHLGPKDISSNLPHSIWGDLNRCREFKRCEPPRAAYGVLGK